MNPGFRTRAAAIVTALLLSACGGGGGGGGSNTPAPEVPSNSSSVSLQASAPTDPVPSGGDTQINVSLSNTGGLAATGVVLTPNLAPGLTLTSVGCTGTGGGICPPSSAASSIALSDLPAKGSLALQLHVKLAAGTSGALTSMPTVQAGNDAVSTDNTAAAVIKAYTADVSISGSGPTAPVAAESTTAYTMTVGNAGPDEARDVLVTNTLGSFQSLGTLSCSASGGASCPTITGPSIRVPTLPKNGSLVFTVQATVMPGVSGSIANVMTVSSGGDPVDTNNAAAVQLSAYVPAPTIKPGQSGVILQSDAGDYIGAGHDYVYTRANANLSVSSNGGRLTVQVSGDENWQADFQQPSGLARIQPGTYAGLKRYPFNDAAAGGLNWSGDGRGCNELTGSFTVTSATYVAGQLSAVELDFEQHCEGGPAALRGQVHWYANDTTAPAGPVNPPPTYLWSPEAGATPATGNYVYLQSDGGDYIGGGRTSTYTQSDAVINITAVGGHVAISVGGDQSWSGDFQAMQGLASLKPGYYANLQRYPFQNPVRGGLSWSGEGRGCNTLTGWFVVDKATYVDNTLSALDLRFEQHCEGGSAALRGKVHWDASDHTAAAGPVNPPPATLWAPADGATPANGSYIYLTSDAGDYIGGGGTYTYTNGNAVLGVNVSGRRLTVSVAGNQDWSGTFEGMNSIAELKPGYYGNLRRYPFNNAIKGGLDWGGEGRGCNTLTGWFVVDSISYANGQLATLDLRFEQHCEGGSSALRGKIHWDASDLAKPPGPLNPPPSNLWTPSAGATPASGNYVYLASDSGDYIGGGGTYSYTSSNATLNISGNGRQITVRVGPWDADFVGMNSIAELKPGYYGGLQRYPFHNTAKGGLSWSGAGRGCNTLTGWFAVDSVSYINGQLAALDLRFEQHCEGGSSALRGKIHWSQ